MFCNASTGERRLVFNKIWTGMHKKSPSGHISERAESQQRSRRKRAHAKTNEMNLSRYHQTQYDPSLHLLSSFPGFGDRARVLQKGTFCDRGHPWNPFGVYVTSTQHFVPITRACTATPRLLSQLNFVVYYCSLLVALTTPRLRSIFACSSFADQLGGNSTILCSGCPINACSHIILE